jgi:gallidermin/nisin family lantibiotic
MSGQSVDAANGLAEAHLKAATAHEGAAHHHRQAAFFVSVNDGPKARQHAMIAQQHAAGAQQQLSSQSAGFDEYDLDVDFQSLEPGQLQPQITSESLCTPTCEQGTGRSFCCSGFGLLC